MTPPSTWRPLPLPGPHPPLLTSTHFASSSYTIHITDLAHFWTESLDRRSIILRALKEDASIDPSDGEENMASFLKCLRSAFCPSEPMHHLTSLSLSPSGNGPAEDDGLVLTVTCELPKELSSTPLTWHMHLAKQPPEATARELVVPLIESHRAQSEKVDGLVEIIRQKDALLSKVLDKLEATGTPLEQVFALGARKRVSREQAEARVKGLAPFNRSAWEAAVGDGESEDVEALVRGVFEGGMEYTPSAEASRFSEGLGGWWRDAVSSSALRDDRESTVGKRTAPPSVGDSQVKSSPVKQRPPPGDATASETGSEDEEAPRQPGRRLGAIGGAKPRTKVPPPPEDEATASESDEKEPPAKSELPHREAPSPAGSATTTEDEPPARSSPAKRGGLGRIGGVARPRQVSEDAEEAGGDATTSEDEAPARPSPAKKGGLGRIGGVARPRREASEVEDEGDDQGVKEKEEREEKKPERKVISRPVKKKRKF